MGRSLSLSRIAPLATAGIAAGVLAGVPLLQIVLDLHLDGLVLPSAEIGRTFVSTLVLASIVTVAALAIGVPLGACFARAHVRARWLLLALHALPLALPPIFVALGGLESVGANGVLGSETTARMLFGPAGVVVSLAIALCPVVTLTMLGVGALNPSFEDAGLLAAGPGRVLFGLLLPAVRPNIVLAACVVFALALAETAVPMFLRVPAYASVVFARIGGIDFGPGEAAVLSLPLLVAGALLSAIAGRPSAALRSMRALREPLDLGAWPTALAATGAAASIAPLVGLLLRARVGVGEVGAWLGHSVSTTLLVALGAAFVAAPIALVLGHASARGDRLARAFDNLLAAGFFVPSAVFGVGVLRAWNRPATSLLYGTVGVVVIALAGRYAVLAVRTFRAAVAATAPTYEEAAAIAGAPPLRRLVAIVLPMHARSLLGAGALTLLFAIRDVETASLLYPPGGETLTVRIFTLEANGPPAVVAALALVQIAVTVGLLAAVGLSMSRLR